MISFCFWSERVISQLLVPKLNGKDLFFSLNFAFCDQASYDENMIPNHIWG